MQIAMILWILFMAGIFFCVFILPVILIVRAHKRYKLNRIILPAVVIGHEEKIHRRSSNRHNRVRYTNRYYPVVQYEYDGQVYQSMAMVNGIQTDFIQKYPVGTQVQIALCQDIGRGTTVYIEK